MKQVPELIRRYAQGVQICNLELYGQQYGRIYNLPQIIRLFYCQCD